MSARPVVSAAREEVHSVEPPLMSAARIVKQVFEEKKP